MKISYRTSPYTMKGSRKAGYSSSSIDEYRVDRLVTENQDLFLFRTK